MRACMHAYRVCTHALKRCTHARATVLMLNHAVFAAARFVYLQLPAPVGVAAACDRQTVGNHHEALVPLLPHRVNHTVLRTRASVACGGERRCGQHTKKLVNGPRRECTGCMPLGQGCTWLRSQRMGVAMHICGQRRWQHTWLRSQHLCRHGEQVALQMVVPITDGGTHYACGYSASILWLSVATRHVVALCGVDE